MKKKLCIVIADYYKDVTDMLVRGSTQQIQDAESRNIIKKVSGQRYGDMFYHVPGVFEIPVTISKLINKYDGFIALGCVIKGETPHFDLISKAVVNKKPIGNGIITCLNMQQAIERADPNKKDIGGKAVLAVLETLANF